MADPMFWLTIVHFTYGRDGGSFDVTYSGAGTLDTIRSSLLDVYMVQCEETEETIIDKIAEHMNDESPDVYDAAACEAMVDDFVASLKVPETKVIDLTMVPDGFDGDYVFIGNTADDVRTFVGQSYQDIDVSLV